VFDYSFDDKRTRAVSVNGAGINEVLRNVYDAQGSPMN
jgi:hypothetical protein